MRLILSPRRPTGSMGKLQFTRSSNGSESLESSYLSTKDHGLHKLSLCSACQKLSVRRMCAPEGCLYLEDLWSLFKTQRECRFCAFIAQTIRGIRDSSLRSQLVGRDLLFDAKYRVYLNLINGRLNVNLREHALLLADIELYCDPGMKCKLACRAEISAKHGYRRFICWQPWYSKDRASLSA